MSALSVVAPSAPSTTLGGPEEEAQARARLCAALEARDTAQERLRAVSRANDLGRGLLSEAEAHLFRANGAATQAQAETAGALADELRAGRLPATTGSPGLAEARTAQAEAELRHGSAKKATDLLAHDLAEAQAGYQNAVAHAEERACEVIAGIADQLAAELRAAHDLVWSLQPRLDVLSRLPLPGARHVRTISVAAMAEVNRPAPNYAPAMDPARVGAEAWRRLARTLLEDPEAKFEEMS